MPNITPDQLAEVARLLAEFTENPSNHTFAAWSDWRTENCGALMLRIAEVEGCVREILQATKRGISQEAKNGEYAVAYGWQCARNEVRDLASRHNIDLSEPTKGTT